MKPITSARLMTVDLPRRCWRVLPPPAPAPRPAPSALTVARVMVIIAVVSVLFAMGVTL